LEAPECEPWLRPARRRFFWAALSVWLLGLCSLVQGQGIESILSPGKLIQGHVKVDDDCAACHVKFDRNAQDGLCTTCHKEVGADMRNRAGYHGRIKPQACRSCHTDHKGREAKIVEFDPKQFDHAQSDFALRGAHLKTECNKCHVAGKKYREAAVDCLSCHRKEDVHKGSLGAKCADCHTEVNWKETKIDHDKTRFPLTGKHVDTKCADCHKDDRYKETPRTCVACHRKDDNGKRGHKGQFGEKCESCHGTKAWKPSTFNHDTETRYVLRGKHRTTGCADCHTGHLFKDKVSSDCYACHKKDDKHKESLGRDCGSCHSERGWKEQIKFDHDKTSFPLLGEHAKIECKACHKSAVYKEAPKECIGCHRKDDKHDRTLGDKCGDCHIERDWKTTQGRFNHDRTKFKLRNAHAEAKLKCNACHKDLRSYRNTPLDCYSCHKKDDKHEGQQGKACEQCHSDASWKVATFDHARTRYPLTGRHLMVECKACHLTPRYRDAPRDCFGCHKKDDKHKLRFGERCESCHNTRAWPVWDYDHDKRANYKLDGAHRKVACETCHQREAPKGRDAAPLGNTCVACHRRDDIHDGQFGVRCEQCHAGSDWKQITNRRQGSIDAPGESIGTTASLLGHASLFNRRTAAPTSGGFHP
jgi:Cytochrome c7 and related cytochrome c